MACGVRISRNNRKEEFMFNVEYDFVANWIHAYSLTRSHTLYCYTIGTHTYTHTENGRERQKEIVHCCGQYSICYIEKIQLDEHLSKFKINSVAQCLHELEKEETTFSYTDASHDTKWVMMTTICARNTYTQAQMVYCIDIRIDIISEWASERASERDWDRLRLWVSMESSINVNVTYKLCERQNHKTYIWNSHS